MRNKSNDKRESSSSAGIFGMLVTALTHEDANTEAIFPLADAEDLTNGATSIPGEVTDARRQKEKVTFVTKGLTPTSWYWLMPDGRRIYND